MISVKMICERNDSDLPEQLIDEGDRVYYQHVDLDNGEKAIEVVVVKEDGDDTYLIGSSFYDKAFVMNECGNTVSVVKKKS